MTQLGRYVSWDYVRRVWWSGFAAGCLAAAAATVLGALIGKLIG